MERVNRLYDCITEIGDDYLKEAEEFCPSQKKVLSLNWKRWGALAAALLLVAGIGSLSLRGGVHSETAATAPAASAPTASEPGASAGEDYFSQAESPAGNLEYQGVISDQVHLLPEKEINFTNGETWVVLPPDEAEKLGLPEDLTKYTSGEPVLWLQCVDGAYIPAEEPTGIELYAYSDEMMLVSDGEDCYVAVKKEIP